jgi:hypothetical protein
MVSHLADDILEGLCSNYGGKLYEGFGQKQFVRYGTNPGSSKTGRANLPVKIPCIKDIEQGQVQNLPAHREIKLTTQAW